MARGYGPTDAADRWLAPHASVVPERELPVLPDDAELEATAAAVPPDRRQLWVSDLPGSRTVWAPTDQRGRAFAVFDHDGSFAGIFVSNLGMVTRTEYETPGFDPEVVLRNRLGDAAYEAQRAYSWRALNDQ